jgi:hypothetical protein
MTVRTGADESPLMSALNFSAHVTPQAATCWKIVPSSPLTAAAGKWNTAGLEKSMTGGAPPESVMISPVSCKLMVWNCAAI